MTTITQEVKYTPKDFQSDQDVRWCPGCGDYSILAQVQRTLPLLNIKKEDYVLSQELVARVDSRIMLIFMDFMVFTEEHQQSQLELS